MLLSVLGVGGVANGQLLDTVAAQRAGARRALTRSCLVTEARGKGSETAHGATV